MPPSAEISRVTRSKRQAMATYDRLSRWYDWLTAGSERPLVNLGIEMIDIHPGEAVLEIGSGTGQALLEFTKGISESRKVHALDISVQMLRRARQRIADQGLSARLALEQADALNQPFDRDTFDAIFMAFTLELFDTPEIPVVLLECRRVLRPEGRICIVAMTREAEENIPERIYEWFHRRMPAYVDCRPIYLRAFLADAGFQLCKITKKKMWGLQVELCLAKKERGDCTLTLPSP